MTRRLTHGLALMGLLLLVPCAAQAQEDGQTFESGLSRQITDSSKHSFLTFNAENDLFGGGTDQNYTSGVSLTWFSFDTNLPPLAHELDLLLPTVSFNKTTSVYYTVGQNLYTPKDITLAGQNPTDRPWAAFLYGSVGLNTVTRNHADNVEATLGIVGPAALGRQTQTFIHRYISNSPRPEGWGNQLRNEPGLILSWERSWPSKPYKFGAFGWTATALPHIGATVGNVYTYANAGASFHLAPERGAWQDAPVRVRPSTPGAGYFIVPEDTFSWYFFGGLETRAIARNIFLDGNTFTDSHRVDKKPLVLDLNGGIAFTYGNKRLSYTTVYRTKEFDGQGRPSIFGTVSLGFRF